VTHWPVGPPRPPWPAAEREVHVWRAAPAAAGLLQDVLAAYLGSAPSITRGLHGKPYLDDEPGLRFNVSHTGDRWAVAIAVDREVGLDIEQRKPRQDLQRLAEAGLTGADAARVAAAPPDERDELFHRLWVRHEARLKCHGTGLIAPLPDGATEVVADLDPWPGVPGAVAAAGPAPVSVTAWTWLDSTGRHSTIR
jgi:phosphopantetheinyl transferase